jgi:hypothetical protein
MVLNYTPPAIGAIWEGIYVSQREVQNSFNVHAKIPETYQLTDKGFGGAGHARTGQDLSSACGKQVLDCPLKVSLEGINLRSGH